MGLNMKHFDFQAKETGGYFHRASINRGCRAAEVLP